MRVRSLKIENFRGVSSGSVSFVGHTLLVGGNNIGKSTICEALDLVLGPERASRRPVVDEHDFFNGNYVSAAGALPIEIRIEAVLVELSDEVRRRLGNHVRRWDDASCTFADEGEGALDQVDGPKMIWALPVIFLGRYDREEDDFIGNTFFEHPAPPLEELDEEKRTELGQGRVFFTRVHKRLCGFVFLRTLRTGSRALSLQRGSLLDSVLKLGGAGAIELWMQTLDTLRELKPGIGDIEQLKQIRDQVRERMGRFVNLAPGDDSTAFFASDLTRENLREVVRLFIAAQPGKHLVPFGRLGTGSINLLVFALLTFIADLKKSRSVIFAMEEPEIALPPHTQRRVTRFVLAQMGQAIVTSHSPYVIEQFTHEQIVLLNRTDAGQLVGNPIDGEIVNPKTFKTERRQFAEAILSRAVLVVEGATELALFPIASEVLERAVGSDAYAHFDLAGVTVFDAKGDNAVPKFGPLFAGLGKLVFAFHDQPRKPFDDDAKKKLKSYQRVWELSEKGIEKLLIRETSIDAIKRFFEHVKDRADYPATHPYEPTAADEDLRKLALNVLIERKGDNFGYAAILVNQCQSADELPPTIREVLETIHKALMAVPEEIVPIIVASPSDQAQPDEPVQ